MEKGLRAASETRPLREGDRLVERRRRAPRLHLHHGQDAVAEGHEVDLPTAGDRPVPGDREPSSTTQVSGRNLLSVAAIVHDPMVAEGT